MMVELVLEEMLEDIEVFELNIVSSVTSRDSLLTNAHNCQC